MSKYGTYTFSFFVFALVKCIFNFTKHFPEESPQMIAAIFCFFPICTQLMKCAAGDIVPSLTRLKKHASQLKFFVSIFGKLNQINNVKSRKKATFENCEIFSNYHFSYARDYKATLLGGNCKAL